MFYLSRKLPSSFQRHFIFLVTLVTLSGLTACKEKIVHHGYIVSDEALSQVGVGSHKEKVDIVMGTPSIKSSLGKKAYYYISETRRNSIFLSPQVVERRILAIYFSSNDRVSQIANYALQDGRIIDFIKNETVTQGNSESNFLIELFSGVGTVSPLPVPERSPE